MNGATILYNRSNQVLMQQGNTISLISYQTEVLRIVNGKIVIDGSRKNTINYTGRQSATTSKHISQAKAFLGLK